MKYVTEVVRHHSEPLRIVLVFGSLARLQQLPANLFVITKLTNE